MNPADAMRFLLQSGPLPPDAELLRQLTSGLFFFLIVSRVTVAPILYVGGRRRPSGREVWWGAFGAFAPLVACIAFLIFRPKRPGPVTGAWNPWVLCPYCQTPRGLTQDPCPNCARPLPPSPQGFPTAPGFAPQPYFVPAGTARPRLLAMDVSGAQVFGAVLFTFLLAGFALYLVLLPLLSNPATAGQQVAGLNGEPWFILGALVLQDSILVAVALDQSLFRGRLTMPEMGLVATRLRFGLPQQLALGVGAGVLTFAISALSVQILIDTLRALGADSGSAAPILQPRIESLSDYAFWIAAAVVIAPVAEELFFRGYALSGFIKRGATNRGLIATSVLFAAVHLDPIALGPLFAAGLVLGTLRTQTGSLIAPVTAHATNNFVVVTLTLLGL